ncbi:MAG: helicase-related protein [candidate division WOR-3 bacterium]
MGSFVPYPEYDDPQFYHKIYSKKEFYDTRAVKMPTFKTAAEIEAHKIQACNPRQFVLQNYQTFARNFISNSTNYNGLLLFWGVGTGKCVLPETQIHFINNNHSSLTIPIEQIWNQYRQRKVYLDDEFGEWSNPKETLLVDVLDQFENHIIQQPIKSLYRQKVVEMIRDIRLENGMHIRITKQHHLLTPKGWTNDFSNVNKIAIIKPSLDQTQPSEITYVNIQTITEHYYSGYVYDLEIDLYHNYIANGIVCHNTCGAIQIAEGFKHEVKKMGKKIYIITKKQLKQNFLKELHSREIEKMERKLQLAPGAMHCVGDTYYISPNVIENEEKRENKILKNIKQYYRFFTPRKFTNMVDCEIIPNLPEGQTIGQYFSGSVIIIDEAHNLTRMEEEETKESTTRFRNPPTKVEKPKTIVGSHCAIYTHIDSTGKKVTNRQSDRKIIDVFNEIFHDSEGIKLILLTATPMRDTADDLILLLDLLLRNDKRISLDDPIPSDLKSHVVESGNKQLKIRDYLFPSEDKVNEPLLRYFARGYVSYVRGEDPVTFPRLRNANNDDIISSSQWSDKNVYIPRPIFNELGKLFKQEEWMNSINVVRCPMSLYHFAQYLNIISKKISEHRDQQGDIVGRQISNIVFPMVDDKSQLYGLIGFKNAFNEEVVTIETGKIKKSGQQQTKKVIKYSYKPNFENFLEINQIGQYSTKFEILMRNIIKSRGIVYVYTDFIESGSLTIALMLESNGFKRYRHPGYLKNDIDPKKLRCGLCGQMSEEHRVGIGHQFRQANYVIFSGRENVNPREMDAINDPENKDGQNIKVVIGTRVSGEGVDFKMVREVHIVDPWHNNTRMYQVIGRAARHCSHILLNEENREVVVYRYCSSPPDLFYHLYPSQSLSILDQIDAKWNQLVVKPSELVFNQFHLPPFTLKQLLTETTDEKIYRRIERKDKFVKKVERILKEMAVDCALNRNINIFDNQLKKDVDGTRECDYTNCQYQCEGFKQLEPPLLTREQINRDTYNIYFSKPQITYIQSIIVQLFEINFVMKLDDIVHELIKINDSFELAFIFEALDNIVGHPPNQKPIVLYDRFGRSGYIIFKKPYYIFQPDELSDPKAPLRYKTTPLTIKRQRIDLKYLRDKLKMPMVEQSEVSMPMPGSTETTLIEFDMKQTFRDLVKALFQNKEYGRYLLHFNLSRLFPPQQAMIYEELRLMMCNPQISTEYRTLYQELNYYFTKRNKLYFYTSHNLPEPIYVGHHIYKNVRKFEIDKTAPESSKTASTSASTSVSASASTCGHWVDSSENDEQINAAKAYLERHAKEYIDQRPIVKQNILGYLEFDKVFKFKIIDFQSQHLKPKKSSKEEGKVEWSRKTIRIGQLCLNYQIKRDIEPIMERLGIANISRTSKKNELCQLIELHLRKLDDIDQNRRWFLDIDQKSLLSSH